MSIADLRSKLLPDARGFSSYIFFACPAVEKDEFGECHGGFGFFEAAFVCTDLLQVSEFADVVGPYEDLDIGVDQFGAGDERVTVDGVGEGDDQMRSAVEGLVHDFDVVRVAENRGAAFALN